jgi:hypothetical protein
VIEKAFSIATENFIGPDRGEPRYLTILRMQNGVGGNPQGKGPDLLMMQAVG